MNPSLFEAPSFANLGPLACSRCSTALILPGNFHILAERDGAIAFFLTCPLCLSCRIGSVVSGMVMGNFRVHTHIEMTDLDLSEARNLLTARRPAITLDDVLDLHQLIKTL